MRRVHRVAAFVAITCVALFWSSTVLLELFGSADDIRFAKRFIAYGMLLLVPAVALTGISGAWMAKGRSEPAVAAKRRRMPVIAANGLLVLLPVALLLNHLAGSASFGATFYALQVLELIAGAVNFALMARSLLAGKRLASGLALS